MGGWRYGAHTGGMYITRGIPHSIYRRSLCWELRLMASDVLNSMDGVLYSSIFIIRLNFATSHVQRGVNYVT